MLRGHPHRFVLGARPQTPEIFSARRRGAALFLVLAACASPDNGFAKLDHPAPLTVLSNLPFGITPEDVRTKDGCYFYEDGGAILPITTPNMTAQGLTGPYCIG